MNNALLAPDTRPFKGKAAKHAFSIRFPDLQHTDKRARYDNLGANLSRELTLAVAPETFPIPAPHRS
jgi:hypothetical protein